METIKIKFGTFWKGFDYEDNIFIRILSAKYNVEITDDPQLYFFTYPYDGNRDYLKYKCHRIDWGCENMRTDWNISTMPLILILYRGFLGTNGGRYRPVAPGASYCQKRPEFVSKQKKILLYCRFK